MFDYRGFSKKYLEEICSDKNIYERKSRVVYWPSEVYSMGYWLRKYANYSEMLPLHCYMTHGIYFDIKDIPKLELDNDSNIMFCFSDKYKRIFEKNSKKKCYKILSPFVYCRKYNGIKKNENGVGTIFFPAHTTPNTDIIIDLKKYINKIKSLPEKFHPICVCLHMHDINRGWHNVFMDNGIPVYSAGNAYSIDFAKNFYDILMNFKYASSNIICSSTFYASEMGIPFFLYGENISFYNHSDTNMKMGLIEPKKNDEYLYADNMFKDFTEMVTDEQKKYVEFNLGLHDSLHPQEIHKILIIEYIKKCKILSDIKFNLKHFFKNLFER